MSGSFGVCFGVSSLRLLVSFVVGILQQALNRTSWGLSRYKRLLSVDHHVIYIQSFLKIPVCFLFSVSLSTFIIQVPGFKVHSAELLWWFLVSCDFKLGCEVNDLN